MNPPMNSFMAQAVLQQPEFESPDPLPSFTTPSRRIAAIREELLSTRYSICLERPELLEKFKKSPQGRQAKSAHPLIRRAMAIAYILSNRMPKIYDHELIIGNMTSKRVAANYYPEGGSINIVEDLFRLENRQIPIYLTPMEKIRLAKIAIKTGLGSVGGRTLLRPGRISHFLDFFRALGYNRTDREWFNLMLRVCS